MIIRIILPPLFFIMGNCQLAFIWMNHQHFHCVQNINTRSYRETIQNQYLCFSALVWTCISGDSVYSHNSSITLDYFCGFINGQNAIKTQTIWDIRMNPNIHIYFPKFLLYNNYWYCDFEYLRLFSNNKSNTFCGIRFPWVHDASDTTVRITLLTESFGNNDYQLELQYYGAYITNHQHFVIFTHPSSILNMYFPNTEPNAFESFHFISNGRLDILHFSAVNICSKHQVVCYDGPGIKSPIL